MRSKSGCPSTHRLAMVTALIIVLGDLVAYLMVGSSIFHTLIFSKTEIALMALGELGLTAITGYLLVGAVMPVAAKVVGGGSKLFAVYCLVLCLLLFWLASSWMLYYATGVFFNLATIHLLLGNPLQLLAHALDLFPLTIIAGTATVLVGTVGLAGIAWSWCSSRASATAKQVRMQFLLLLLAGFAAFLAGQFHGKRQANPALTMESQFSLVNWSGNGPMRGLLWSLINSVLGPRVLMTPGMEQFVRRMPIQADSFPVADPDRAPRLNVMIVVVESLRSDRLQSFGGDLAIMPGVDALAARSRRFDNLYAQASHSNYSDLVLLTSAYPLRSNGSFHYPKLTPYPVALVYDLLKPLGYATAVISSQNEHWGGMSNFLDRPTLDVFHHAGGSRGLESYPWASNLLDGVSVFERSGKLDDRDTIDTVIRWIDSQPTSQPFFLYTNLQNSHLPFHLPADFEPPIALPEGIESVDFSSGTMQINLLEENIRPGAAEVIKVLHANSLAYIDQELSRLFEYLEESGLMEHTVLILTADTGFEFYEHGHLGYGSQLFDEVVKVPMLIHAPGMEAGVDHRLAAHLDIAPTLLSILNLGPYPGFQGRDLTRADYQPGPVFSMTQTPLGENYAIIDAGYKLMLDVQSGHIMLFDLERDPGESVNLWSAEQALSKSLYQRLELWRAVQLEYYANTRRQRREYPPQFDFPPLVIRPND